MQLDVFNTYVTRDDGVVMHFDVLMPKGSASEHAQSNALDWLQTIGITANQVLLDSCQYCHSEDATPEIERDVQQQGYFILQMEGCPSPIF
jgi:hypothetical protein